MPKKHPTFEKFKLKAKLAKDTGDYSLLKAWLRKNGAEFIEHVGFTQINMRFEPHILKVTISWDDQVDWRLHSKREKR